MKNINEELTKSDVENIVSREIASEHNSDDFRKHIKKIAAEVIEDLYKTLWNRSSSWKGGLVR